MVRLKKMMTHVTSRAIYLDIQLLIRSVLDGYNVCIFSYGQTLTLDIQNNSQLNGLNVPDASWVPVSS